MLSSPNTVPQRDLEVGGDDEAAFLVAVGDDLEQEPGMLSRARGLSGGRGTQRGPWGTLPRE